ncbi:hypothetical protein L226DRAFT_538228 [Lentinus tigrinus ALCF2SS1-7]|uniref:Uncharacterized protein n=1 Tax=Lentinus tigrinus ALCF2SS1-6 TaxID=1328759 RepID=A0A5C2RX08_9APHY|nr:hypothetical protein L227DRAFT_579803 [Lentinus tigrinus ALCF2SS1-6]RPD71361.1 hypothetical protein L226DRAFT_538228 [Lentinus tigrinus ALCF2SS1-7]
MWKVAPVHGEIRPRVLSLSSPVLVVDVERDAIRAVNVVRLSGDTLMLPISLYLCALLDPVTIVSGIEPNNGQCDRLTDTDALLCLDARATLMLRRVKRIQRTWLMEPVDDCVDSYRCAKVLNSTQRSHLTNRDFVAWSHVLFLPITNSKDHRKLCKVCQKGVAARELEELRYAWKQLPSDLDYPFLAGMRRFHVSCSESGRGTSRCRWYILEQV